MHFLAMLRVLLVAPTGGQTEVEGISSCLSSSHSTIVVAVLSSPEPISLSVEYSCLSLDFSAPPSSLPPADVVTLCCGVEPRTKNAVVKSLSPLFGSSTAPPPQHWHCVPYDVERFTSMSEERSYVAADPAGVDDDGDGETTREDKYGADKTVAFVIGLVSRLVQNGVRPTSSSTSPSESSESLSLLSSLSLAASPAAAAVVVEPSSGVPPLPPPPPPGLPSESASSSSSSSSVVVAPKKVVVRVIDLGLKEERPKSEEEHQESGRFRRQRGKSKAKHGDNLNRQYSSKDNGNRTKYVFEET